MDECELRNSASVAPSSDLFLKLADAALVPQHQSVPIVKVKLAEVEIR